MGEVPQFPDVTAGNHPVVSNEIEITIVEADAAGLANELEGITAILDSDEKPERKSRPPGDSPISILRKAAAEMARRFGNRASDRQSLIEARPQQW